MTKNIFSVFILTAFTCLFFGSCRKYSPVETHDQVGISKVTYYANLHMAGEPYMSILKGETFTDPGVTADILGETTPVTVTGAVDNTTEGFYVITYTAINKDGFPSSTQRTVAVLAGHEVPGTDISGDYYYVAAPATTSTVTKLAEGFYYTTNVYSASTTIPALFVTLDGAAITFYNQQTGFGLLYGSGTLATDGSLTYSINLPKYGIANSIRRWHK